MNYDVTALIQSIKTRAKDSSLSDSLITEWLQETQDQVLGHYRFPFLEVATSPTLVVNDLTYAYPTDLQVVLGVKLVNGTQVVEPQYLSYGEFEATYRNPAAASAGPPRNYTDFARLLYWDRPIDVAYVLKFKYLRRPVTLTGAVTPDIPVEYKEILIRGGLARAEENRENFDIAALHQRKLEDLAEDMLQRYGMRQLVTPHRAKLNGRRMGRVGRSFWGSRP